MKKILFYCDTVFGVGGVQRVLAEVAKRLSEEYEVTILTTDDIRQTRRYDYHRSSVRFVSLIYAPVSIWRRLRQKCCSFVCKYLLPKNEWTCSLYARSFFLLPYQDELIEKINGGNYDVAIGVHAYCCLHLAIVRSKLNVPRTVGWMHNSYEAFFEKKHPYLPRLKAFFCNRMVDIERIIVLSRRDQQRYKTELGLETRVIYNPLTMEVKRTARPDNKSFLSVGRFSKNHKGFDLLISAFDRLKLPSDKWELTIIGEGKERANLECQINQVGLSNNIHLVGRMGKNEIAKILSSSDVFIFPSRSENFSVAVLEALCLGMPVIASICGGIKECVNSSNGLLFPVEDIGALSIAINTMYENCHQYDRKKIMTDNCARFTPSVIARQLTDVFNEVVIKK